MGDLPEQQIRGAFFLFAHAKLDRIGDRYVLSVYHEQTKALVERLALSKGIKVEVTLKRVPRFYLSESDLWEQKKEDYPILKEFEKKLGLKLC